MNDNGFAVVDTPFMAFLIGFLVWSLWVESDFKDGASNMDVESIRLTPFHGKTESGVIHGEIVLTVDRTVRILLEGDIVVMGFLHIDGQNLVPNGEGYIIYYSGPLQLVEPKSVGNEVNILIRHGGSETAVTAVLEGRHATAGAGS